MPPETFMAARGGLAQLPSHLHFDGGGIVAFAGPGGSAVKAGPEFIRFLRQMGIDYIEYSKMSPAIQDNIKEAFQETGGARPTAAAPAAQSAQAAQAATANRMYAPVKTAAQYGTKAVKSLGLPGALASAVENFGDYKLKSDDDIDTSASGTFNDLKRGNIGRAANGLGMGLGEIVADAGSAVANTADYVVPGKAPVSSAYDKLLRSTGLFKDKPEGEDVQQANMASENERLAAKAPSAGTPIGTEGRRTGPVAEGVNPNANPNLVPANIRPQVKPRPRPEGGLPNLQQTPPAPPAAAAPTGPAPGSAEAMAMAAVKDKEKPMTLDEAIAQRRQAEAAFGLNKPAGLEKLARADEMDATYKAGQPDNIDNLIRTLGRAGQFKGLSGTGSAYTATQDENRARQMAHLEKMNTLRGGVEDTQRAESTAGMTGATATFDKSKQQAADLNKERMNSLAQMAGNEQQERTSKYSADSSAATSRYTADMHYKAAMAQAGMANKRADAADKRAIMDSFRIRIASIDKDLATLGKSFRKEDREAAEGLRAEKAGLTKALDEHSGISKITETPGAGSPGGNTRIRFDANGNQIK
jgi:hypothetical protein